jgi:hypothetical protein
MSASSSISLGIGSCSPAGYKAGKRSLQFGQGTAATFFLQSDQQPLVRGRQFCERGSDPGIVQRFLQ